jgi:hypothetical protein
MSAAWKWIAKPNGAVLLAEVETGHTVMDCVRKSMQACVPRFASWPGLPEGEPRAGREGVMAMAQSWFDADGRLTHPHARTIEASPALLDALARAQAKLTAALQAHPAAVPHLVAEAHAIQAGALAAAGAAA